MTQWRDEQDADLGSIEELETVARRPARVGSSRSARIPALIVATLLVGVVAAGVSGRTEPPPTPVPPMAATDASPAPPPSDSPGDEPFSPPGPLPATPQPFPVEVTPDFLSLGDELRFWLVVLSDDERLLRIDLDATHGFYQSVPIDRTWGDDIRARLVGRAGTNAAIRVADVRVVQAPNGSLDLPLELGSGIVRAQALESGDPNGRLSDLRYELRLEHGRGRPGPTLLVAEVYAAYTTTYTSEGP